MNPERRKFLQQLAAACATGVGRSLGIGASVLAGAAATGSAASANATVTAASAATAGVAVAAGAYGAGVRAQVFEVVVRQAIAGAPWKQICAGPLQVNSISEEEVEKEVKRRVEKNKHTGDKNCLCRECLERRLEAAQDYWLKHQARLDAIPHSMEPPCACNDCYKKIMEMRRLIY